MADPKRLILESQGFLAASEANWDTALYWMAELLKGHPKAQDFEPTGHGGSDPTLINGIQPDVAAFDGKRAHRLAQRIWRDSDELACLLRRYQPGVRPKRKPDDVQDVWCVLHLELDAHEPRYRNDLCRPCSERKYQTGDFPTLDDVRYHTQHGRWPRQRVDPKQPPTRRIAGLENLQDGLATLKEGTA